MLECDSKRFSDGKGNGSWCAWAEEGAYLYLQATENPGVTTGERAREKTANDSVFSWRLAEMQRRWDRMHVRRVKRDLVAVM